MSPSQRESSAGALLGASAVDAVLPTDLERIRPIRRCVESLLASEGWCEEDAADVGLVVTELLQNAIEHGSRGDGLESVTLRCTVPAKGTVLIDVTDPGTGKGLASLLGRDVTTPPPIDAVRGRGLFLVHRMSKSLERAGGAEGRSVVRIRFLATSAPDEGAS